MRFFRDVAMWFAAGMGLEIQGRAIDHWLDPLTHAVWWLAWLQ